MAVNCEVFNVDEEILDDCQVYTLNPQILVIVTKRI
jgi:hypothetical protein